MRKLSSPVFCVLSLLIIALFFCAIFFFWHFSPLIWTFRAAKLALLVIVACSIAISTILFQTVSNNRILTPSIMGFDQLYILVQTTIVFFLGQVSIPGVSAEGQFVIDTLILIIFAVILFRWLFSGSTGGIHLTMIIGVVCGSFFFSLRMLMQLKLDPDAAVRLTDIMFASFNKYNTNLLFISILSVTVVGLIIWRMRFTFDVLALGRETAISLGINFRKMTSLTLMLVAILVAVSTALVGPVTFFGLLVASLAYQLSPSSRHAIVLPVAALLAVILLVGGEFILEQVFNMGSRLAFITEFFGGIVFIMLLIKGKLR